MKRTPDTIDHKIIRVLRAKKWAIEMARQMGKADVSGVSRYTIERADKAAKQALKEAIEMVQPGERRRL